MNRAKDLYVIAMKAIAADGYVRKMGKQFDAAARVGQALGVERRMILSNGLSRKGIKREAWMAAFSQMINTRRI